MLKYFWNFTFIASCTVKYFLVFSPHFPLYSTIAAWAIALK